METRADEPINPVDATEENPASSGMTKREEFAKAAMQGILAERSTLPTPANVATDAVAHADALINQLNNTTET